MQRELLQEKSINRMNDNAEKSVNVDLSAKSRLIPFSDTAAMFGLNDLYNEERDACETYRMVFTVNPICSNVLYNAVTEPVYKEGSDDAINLVETSVARTSPIFTDKPVNTTTPIKQQQAVKDTEYSNERIGNFKYHCGYDIFNNHLLRTNEFEHVAEAPGNESIFNTIEGYAVDYNGKIVERVIGESTGPFNGNPSTSREKVRMYALDTIKSMNTAFYDGLRTVDGWYGFYNSGYINIPNAKVNNKEVYVNRILNNESPCAFVDLYPDRSLFSFIPKVNRFRKRLERNWDCTLVYPYENDVNLFNIVNENKANAVKVVSASLVYNNAGDEQILMTSLLRHTLKQGDQIRLFYCGEEDDPNEDLVRYSVPVTVIGVGNEEGEEINRYFKIRASDIRTFCEVYEDDATGEKALILKRNSDDIRFFYRKIEGGCDNRYYFRKFKPLMNCQYVEMTGAYIGDDLCVLRKVPEVVNENSPKHIKIDDTYFELDVRPLMYSQNKIAFGENIYGDRVAQVIFTDDICTSGLKDNLGRPITTVYFAAVKTNRGHKKWYDDKLANDENIEYSHCFGEITSGLDLPSGVTDYNVRALHNVCISKCPNSYRQGLEAIMIDAPKGSYTEDKLPRPIEDGITIDMNVFYGDIVEFSRVNYIETPIEKVYHRFNTAQRECVTNTNYFDIHYDELVGDIYDVDKI